MPVDINTILANLEELGIKGNERVAYFLYGTLLESYYNKAANCASINGFIGMDNNSIVKLAELYTAFKKNIDGEDCSTIYIDAGTVPVDSDIFGDIVKEANDGKRMVVVLRNVEDNVLVQEDIIRFAASLSGKKEYKKLDVRNSVEVFYTAKDLDDLAEELVRHTTRYLTNEVLKNLKTKGSM